MEPGSRRLDRNRKYASKNTTHAGIARYTNCSTVCTYDTRCRGKSKPATDEFRCEERIKNPRPNCDVRLGRTFRSADRSIPCLELVKFCAPQMIGAHTASTMLYQGARAAPAPLVENRDLGRSDFPSQSSGQCGATRTVEDVCRFFEADLRWCATSLE